MKYFPLYLNESKSWLRRFINSNVDIQYNTFLLPGVTTWVHIMASVIVSQLGQMVYLDDGVNWSKTTVWSPIWRGYIGSHIISDHDQHNFHLSFTCTWLLDSPFRTTEHFKCLFSVLFCFISIVREILSDVTESTAICITTGCKRARNVCSQ